MRAARTLLFSWVGPTLNSPDLAIADWVTAHRLGWMNWLASSALKVGTNVLVLGFVVVAAFAFVVFRRLWFGALIVGTGIVLAFGVSGLLKQLIGRPRPPAGSALVHVSGYSMPSTDGAVTAAAALALFLVARRAGCRGIRLLGVVLTVGVGLVGVCMIYLSAHWTTDVLAGWVLGAAVGGDAMPPRPSCCPSPDRHLPFETRPRTPAVSPISGRSPCAP